MCGGVLSRWWHLNCFDPQIVEDSLKSIKTSMFVDVKRFLMFFSCRNMASDKSSLKTSMVSS